ncbi:MAG TPA: SDR family oxidoreductase [Myxococcota bacterium]|jgi:NAD(P)-dependent dehydrogenase (short-subunit alcohol dehydrogenase family)|nr:SDR family oxidoreductase [Myxococcota bacterium]
MGLLDGKVAIVTGAGGGIGREHALAMAREGAKVVVNDLGGTRDGSGASHNLADKVVEEIKALGGQAVANYDSVATMAGGKGICETALKAFGKVDILVNNAGILRDKTLAKLEEENWDIVNAVHLKGTFCVTQPVYNHMRERNQGGVIINTSSTSGLEGNFGQCNYGAAKAGIWGFSRCLAIEGKKANIRVFVLAPVAHTRLTEDLPFFQAEETKHRMDPKLVSPLVVFLASDLAKDLSGRTFFVGGGTIAEMKMVRGEGATKKENGGLWTPEEIAASLDKILQ